MSLRRYYLVARMFARMVGRVPPAHLLFLLRRMGGEKPHRFRGQVRINSFFPPYPSPAFDRFCAAVIARRRVPHSVYLAATAQCPYACGHCSYAARDGRDLSTGAIRALLPQIKALGASTLGLTGGEPLQRDDLEAVLAAAKPELATVVFSTGHGLDAARARRLAAAGLDSFTLGVESAEPAVHDQVRGRAGSFAAAEAAARHCREAGVYLALSTVATRPRIGDGTLERLYALAEEWGAGELRILAPVATGAWAGCATEMLTAAERAALGAFHRAHNRRAGGPAVAALAYLESGELFGCGAGYHHLFIDAAGRVCPCDLTPLSFGDSTQESLAEIWERMGEHFAAPRRCCLMQEIAPKIDAAGRPLPLAPEESETLCGACRPEGPLPEGYRRLLGR